MHLLTDTLDSLWQVVAVGLLFGAGLPAIFAFGLKSLSLPNADGTEGPSTLGKMVRTSVLRSCSSRSSPEYCC